MALTDTSIRNAKPGAKPRKLTDERGLFLLVTPAGGKWWRFRYKLDGKEKLLSLGTYPDVSLVRAREKRDEARRLLADGIDPPNECSAVAHRSVCRSPWREQRRDIRRHLPGIDLLLLNYRRTPHACRERFIGASRPDVVHP